MNVKVDELVMKVSPANPRGVDFDAYDDFLDLLCEHRDYNKAAVREAACFLLGGAYANTEALARENFFANPALQEFYGSADALVAKLPFPERLACSLDMATGTGKSFVMYALAQILLCEGAVDQVLVLCPSTTIERGLTQKFKALASDSNFRASLPKRSGINNPRIVNSSVTVQSGDICENIHATYERTGSSINYSLKGHGARTLVLSDEAHHIFNAGRDEAFNQWGKFLASDEFGFRYLVGLSGTPYVGNDYFTDVVYRYPLLTAMEQGFIKTIHYVQKDESRDWAERMQIIYDNHTRNQSDYSHVKPLTILVTQTIAGAKKLAEQLREFVRKREKLTKTQAEAKVMVVTSSAEHKQAVAMLDKVDSRNNPVEWITSVSMLTEGWDVKNVFQIVPHEEKAFNSKLLIAQVLGCGLRIPPAYANVDPPPVVTVFNHANWSSRVKDLVDEVMGTETRVRSYPVDKPTDHNFTLHNLNYEKKDTPVTLRETPGADTAFPSKVTLGSLGAEVMREVEYTDAVSHEAEQRQTNVQRQTWAVEEVAHDVFTKLAQFDDELATRIDAAKVTSVIEKSLKAAGLTTDDLTKDHKRAVEKAYSVMHRRATGHNEPPLVAKDMETTETRTMREVSAGITELKQRKDFIHEANSVSLSKPEDARQISETVQALPRSKVIDVPNAPDFKCPLNVVILSHRNEIAMGRHLIRPDVAMYITAWVKSPDTGFYSIPYSYRMRTHQKEGSFNPDFFLLVSDDVLVIEVKSEDDVTEVNKAKLRAASKHFDEINSRLQQQNESRRYHFKFLAKEDLTNFFDWLNQGRHGAYKSTLEAQLEQP